jgi:hypothetical protein
MPGWLVNRFLYHPTSHWMMTPADLGLEAEDIFLTPERGVQLHAWFFRHLKRSYGITLRSCGKAGR